MKLSTQAALTTFAVGIPAFFMGRAIWPPAAGLPEPTAGQLPFFVFLAAVEALFFGLGVAFIALGAPLLKKLPAQERGKTVAAFVSLAWLLVSWWPHGNLHIHMGEDVQGILYIDYGFHLTVIIASLVLARYFFSRLRKPE